MKSILLKCDQTQRKTIKNTNRNLRLVVFFSKGNPELCLELML